jgi:hypothetical protein
LNDPKIELNGQPTDQIARLKHLDGISEILNDRQIELNGYSKDQYASL